ncbi:MAG: 50S ribosomal protein L10 [Candidatus Omnitrophota bacterium]
MKEKLKPGKLLKNHMITEIGEHFKNAGNFFITDCGLLTNRQIEELRSKLRKTSCKYVVIKNSMCKIALENNNLKDLASYISGACAVAFDSHDPVVVSKILVEYTRENEKFLLKGAYIYGEAVAPKAIKELALIPPRSVLLTRLVTSLNSPASSVVGTLSGIIRKFVYAINAVKEKKAKEGGK